MWWDLAPVLPCAGGRQRQGHRCDSQRVPSESTRRSDGPATLPSNELLDAIRAGGEDVVRQAIALVLQPSSMSRSILIATALRRVSPGGPRTALWAQAAAADNATPCRSAGT
jgi:hypothetical protein